ncbi:MAG: GIY-YIG nuclease family protein [Candidatus Parcubacteria bacterium]|nr:GIY-YIG nuclease family protein [Candidatus Parcubacteria bacterium]
MSQQTPKTVKIFLINGEPDGLRTVELSNWVGQAIIIPRNKLRDVKNRNECGKPSIYFLIGKETEDLESAVYIGEADMLYNRLFDHDMNKDFWNVAIAFVSKDNNLTKAHVKYLESRCLSLATRAKRYEIKNGKESSLSSLPEADIAEMEEFLNNLQLLLASLGFPILQEIISKEQVNVDDPLLVCEGKNVKATGRMTNEGFVVYKDSTATSNISKAVKDRNIKIIDRLISGGYIKSIPVGYEFIKDFVFNSPSAASDIVLGNSTSGWELWKTTEGKKMREVYEK